MANGPLFYVFPIRPKLQVWYVSPRESLDAWVGHDLAEVRPERILEGGEFSDLRRFGILPNKPAGKVTCRQQPDALIDPFCGHFPFWPG
jgi:hypothetical protein